MLTISRGAGRPAQTAAVVLKVAFKLCRAIDDGSLPRDTFDHCAITWEGVMAISRELMSSEEIAALINDSTSVVEGLADTKISVRRIPNAEPGNCNWLARVESTPFRDSAENQQLIHNIVENARRHFNLWEVH